MAEQTDPFSEANDPDGHAIRRRRGIKRTLSGECNVCDEYRPRVAFSTDAGPILICDKCLEKGHVYAQERL